MQKKLIALAVAGLVSAPAFAQSNVTIYGVADAYMSFGSHGDNDLAAVGSGGLAGSRIGFRGTEALGNGLNAVFTLEQGVEFDDSLDSLDGQGLGGKARQSFVGVSGAWGTISLGRQYAPGYDFQYDAVVSSSALSPQSILSNTGSAKDKVTMDASNDARWDSSVAYNGSFAGLKVRAIYAMDNEDTKSASNAAGNWADPSDDDLFGLGVEYANGPLKVGAVYHLIQNGSDAVGQDDQTEWLVGGSYNFGMLTLAGSYQDVKSAGGIKNDDLDIWQVGVIVPVGAAGNVHVAYGEADVDYQASAADGKAKSYTLAYTHALSKRTTLYTGYNRTDNDNGLAFGPVRSLDKAASTSTANQVAKTGDESDLFVVGVNHKF